MIARDQKSREMGSYQSIDKHEALVKGEDVLETC